MEYVSEERKSEVSFRRNLFLQIIILIIMFVLLYMNKDSVRTILILVCLQSLNWLIISIRVWRWITK